MSLRDITRLLDDNPGMQYTAKEISKEIDCNIQSTYNSLRRILKREGYTMEIMSRTGRGDDKIMVYSSGGKER